MEHARAAGIHLTKDAVDDAEFSLDDEMRQVVREVLASTGTLGHDENATLRPLNPT